MRRFEREHLFWEVELDGAFLTTRFGGRGQRTRTVLRELASITEAQMAYDRAVDRKRGIGFEAVDAETEGGRRLRRQRTLEEAIFDAPDDLEAWQVYSDWMLEQPNAGPRARLAAVELAIARGDTDPALAAEVRKLHANHRDQLWRLPSDMVADDVALDRADFETKFGFMRVVRTTDATIVDRDAARFVQEIGLGPQDTDHAENLAFLSEFELPALRRLYTAYDRDQAELSWLNGGSFTGWKRAPRLRELELAGSEIGLGEVHGPALQKLTIITTGLPAALVESLIEGHLPVLSDLELWTGAPYRVNGRAASRADIRALLQTDLPLRRLAIRNCQWADDLVEDVLASPLLPKLEVLDLQMGTLHGPGLATIAANADAFAHLDKIDLHLNCLEDPGPLPLANIELGRQRSSQYWGEDTYYIALPE